MLYRIIAVALLCFCQSHTLGASATIATATNFKHAMDELISAFQQESSHSIRQVNASSGVLFNQIIFGAPFDVFLSADARYPAELENRKEGSSSPITYAIGQLVVVINGHEAPPADDVAAQLTAALNSASAKIAIANPNTAPYGRAAQQVLQHLQQWDLLQNKLVQGNNVGQTFQFVATTNAELGFVAQSQVRYFANDNLSVWPIPGNWYQPIRQQAILLQFGRQNPAAHSFLEFLTSARAKTIIQSHGYLTP